MSNSDAERALFQSFREGRREGIKYLFDKYATRIREYLQKKTGDSEAAREKTLDAFTHMYNVRETIRDEEHFRRSCYVVARNFCRDFLRERKKTQALKFDLQYLTQQELNASSENETELVRGETLLALRSSWKKLSARRRRIIVLYYFHGLTSQVIAHRLNISRQTVLNHLSQSIVMLRQDLNGRWEENNPLFS